MLNLGAHRKDRTVALIAATILLLQLFFTAWTAGAMASGAMQADAWGNALCITSVGDDTSSDAAIKVPNCCTMGCGLSATSLSDPGGSAVPAHPDRSGTAIVLDRGDAGPALRPDHDPGSPRAPPLIV